MDEIRERLREQTRNRHRKLLIGFVVIIILVLCVVFFEKNISMRPTDVTIMKSEISEEKAIFIPLKKLDTNIIAVKTTDGSFRLAFDDCTGCYYQFGTHATFENNADNTGLICKNCKNEIMYEEMGFLPEESMPIPISETEITVLDDQFIIPAEYLESKKSDLEQMRKGKAVNNYSENTSK